MPGRSCRYPRCSDDDGAFYLREPLLLRVQRALHAALPPLVPGTSVLNRGQLPFYRREPELDPVEALTVVVAEVPHLEREAVLDVVHALSPHAHLERGGEQREGARDDDSHELGRQGSHRFPLNWSFKRIRCTQRASGSMILARSHLSRRGSSSRT